MDLDRLAHHSGEWLRGVGPESDIVVSSRVRLARNLADFPFIARATDADREEIQRILGDQVRELRTRLSEAETPRPDGANEKGKTPAPAFNPQRIAPGGDQSGPGGATPSSEVFYVDVSGLDEIDRQFLVERQLISRELAETDGARAVAIDGRERFSVMINEEDHLRIQVMRSGLDLPAAWDSIAAIDDALEEVVTFAYSDKLGYLTACPTNVGTGARISVMLHLPALVITRQIDKVFRSLQKINLAVRGLYGEGSQAMGDFYQISNQVTLGASEQELTKKVADVVPVLLDYERQAREFLVRESQETLHDRVSRAFGILRTAQTITSEETLHLLSSVRMGVNLGLIRDITMPTVNKLFVHTQPAHLQKLAGMELDSSDRAVQRASYLRRHLAGDSADPANPGNN